LLPALGTGDGDLDALLDTRNLGGGYGCQSIVLSLFTRLATLRLVLQAFVVKKNLLTNSPNELFTTIDATDSLILKVRRLRLSGCENFAV
jgi:hypothetical protein